MPAARRQVNVAIARNTLENFRRRAKKAWPKEAYGLLLGMHRGPQWVIEDIYYPVGVEDATTTACVDVTEGMWAEAAVAAGWQNADVLGDIHSHPYSDPAMLAECVPSQIDLDRFREQYLQGIMAIVKHGGRMRSRCRFFAPAPETTVTILR